MKERIQRTAKQVIIPYLFTTYIIVLAYQGFYRFGFGADTITHALYPLSSIFSMLNQGRFATLLIEYGLHLCGIDLVENYRLFFLIFIACVGWGAVLIQEVFLSVCRERHPETGYVREYAVRLIFTLPFSSTLFSEYMFFPECFCYGLGFVLTGYALVFLRRKKLLLTGLFLILSCTVYQNQVILFAIFAVLLVVLEEDMLLNLRVFLKVMAVIAAGLGTGVLDLAASVAVSELLALTDVPKGITLRSIPELAFRVETILAGFFSDGIGLVQFPCTNLILLGVSAAAAALVFLREKPRIRMVTYLLTVLAAFCLSLVIGVLQGAPPRIVYTLYAALSVAVFVPYLYGSCREVLAGLAALSAVLQLFSCSQIAVNHYMSNTYDLTYAGMVLDRINAYEEETGIAVKTLQTCRDAVYLSSYDDIYYTCYQINERALGIVSYSLVEYVQREREGNEERRFVLQDIDEEIYAEYFEGKDWDSFDAAEQVLFIGDTAYWCVF